MSIIKSDDPKALEKLTDKVTKLKEAQEEMKSRNAYFRKHGTMVGYKDMSDDVAKKIDEKVANAYSWEKQPYPSYRLQGNNQEIKRLEGRIAEIKRKTEVGYVGWEFNGGKAIVNNELNRLQLVFDEKPDEQQRAVLKMYGFKWSPSNAAWQRMLNDNAFYSARRVDFIQPKDNKDIVAMQPKAPKKDDLAR